MRLPVRLTPTGNKRKAAVPKAASETVWRSFSRQPKHKKLEKCSYAELVGLIKELKNKLPDGMGYDQIDHIIWYCYRNDPLRAAIAAALAK